MIQFLKEHTQGVIIVSIIVVVILLILYCFRHFLKKNVTVREKIRSIVTVSIFTALSVVFYITFKFSLPIFPSFLKINFSNLFIILAALLLGPIDGVVTVLVRTLIVLPMTESACVGEFADLLISISIVLVVSLIYKKLHTKKGATIALVSSTITWVVIGLLANAFILVPAYITLFFNGDVNGFISMLQIIPNVTIENYLIKYLLIGVLPFNILLSTVVNFVTFIVYKKISLFFHKFDDKKDLS